MSNSPSTRKRFSGRILILAALTTVALMLAGTASASAGQYWINQSKTAPSDHCYAGAGYVDLVPTAPTGSTSTAFAGGSRFACTQPFPAGAELAAGSGSFDLWFTNTNKKPCTTTWYLYTGATATRAGTPFAGNYYGDQYITVPANTRTPLKVSQTFPVQQRTLPPGDQVQLHVNVRTASGSCSNMTLHYGSVAHPSNVNLPTLIG